MLFVFKIIFINTLIILKFTWLVFWITGVIGGGRGLLSIGGWTINGGPAEWWTAATEFMTGAISTCWTVSPERKL